MCVLVCCVCLGSSFVYKSGYDKWTPRSNPARYQTTDTDKMSDAENAALLAAMEAAKVGAAVKRASYLAKHSQQYQQQRQQQDDEPITAEATAHRGLGVLPVVLGLDHTRVSVSSTARSFMKTSTPSTLPWPPKT